MSPALNGPDANNVDSKTQPCPAGLTSPTPPSWGCKHPVLGESPPQASMLYRTAWILTALCITAKPCWFPAGSELHFTLICFFSCQTQHRARKLLVSIYVYHRSVLTAAALSFLFLKSHNSILCFISIAFSELLLLLNQLTFLFTVTAKPCWFSAGSAVNFLSTPQIRPKVRGNSLHIPPLFMFHWFYCRRFSFSACD